MELIDVHSHLQDKEFDNDREEVIKSAKANGVTKIIVSTLGIEDSYKTLEMFQSYKGFIYVTAGCNPFTLDNDEIRKIQDLIRSKKEVITGIGEVGLDFYRGEESEHIRQKEIFKSWISLAKELDMPLIVHSRSAGKYAIEILLAEGYYNVLMHAYDGKVGSALKGAEKGFYFSIPPSVVHSEQKQKLVKALGIENLMLESDSPVLGPERDKRNEPSNLRFALKKISELKGLSEEEIALKTTRNAIEFFKLGG